MSNIVVQLHNKTTIISHLLLIVHSPRPPHPPTSSTVLLRITLILLELRPVIRSVRGVLCYICLGVNDGPLLGSCVCLADHGGEVSLGEPLCDLEHLLVCDEALQDGRDGHPEDLVEHLGCEVADEAHQNGRDPDVVDVTVHVLLNEHVREEGCRDHDEELSDDQDEAATKVD